MPKNPYQSLPIRFYYLFWFGVLISVLVTIQEYLNYLIANYGL